MSNHMCTILENIFSILLLQLSLHVELLIKKELFLKPGIRTLLFIVNYVRLVCEEKKREYRRN